MKIRTLTIHNIASIADATIDFEAEPLATSDLFLISGETGAGKSTILDAICLALYDETPRFANTKMQGDAPDKKGDVKVDDPRQLLRVNSGEAYVKLLFTGNNGQDYEATWSVARAWSKVDGNLKSRERQLENLSSGTVLTKLKDVDEEVRKAVGLDFNQFCRTTMLAQGDFTRFLNSSDNEKAEILEKITGVDIYSKIGRKIFNISTAKQKAWQQADEKVANIKVLTPEEIAESREKIRQCDERHASLKAQHTVAETKRKWLSDLLTLAQSVDSASREADAAKAMTESPAFKASEQLATRWNATIEPRGWLNALLRAEKDMKAKTEEVEKARTEFAGLQRGLGWVKEHLRSLRISLKDVENALDAEKDSESIYNARQTIEGLLTSVAGSRQKIDSEHEALRANEHKLNDILMPAKKEADEKYAQAKDKLEAQETRLKDLEHKVETADLPQLRKQKDENRELADNCSAALEKIKSLRNARELRAKMVKNIAEYESRLKELIDEGKGLDTQVRDAQIKTDTCREMLDRQRETVDSWAKAMRAKLHPGDVCPVCRQAINGELPHEDMLDALFASAEKAWREADSQLAELKDKTNKAAAEIRSQETLLDRARKELAGDSSVDEAVKAVAEACRRCSSETCDESAEPAITDMMHAADSRLKTLKGQIDDAENLDAKAKDSRKNVDRLRKNAEKALAAVNNAQRRIDDCKGMADGHSKLIELKQKELEDACGQLSRLLDGSKWQESWTDDIPAFRSKLSTAADTFNAAKADSQRLENEIREANKQVDDLTTVMNSIKCLLPDQDNLSAGEPMEIKDLLRKSTDLLARIQSSIDQRETARNSFKEYNSKLQTYYAGDEAIGPEELTALNAHSQMEVSGITIQNAKLREDFLTKDTILKHCCANLEHHKTGKPEMAEDDTLETLAKEMSAIDNGLVALVEERASLTARLLQDEENKKQIQDLLQDAGEKKKVADKWGYLSSLIGSADGAGFRKIAQSYVLASLIHSANAHMRSLTDRYTLKVVPGTFVILLEDAYQGFTSRAASTISGGESFLVSLALALALSDIGDNLMVDTLFIDEGFGSLSGEPLQNAVNTLRTLHAKAGRRVGVISHIEELRERIPVQIQVTKDQRQATSRVQTIVVGS